MAGGNIKGVLRGLAQVSVSASFGLNLDLSNLAAVDRHLDLKTAARARPVITARWPASGQVFENRILFTARTSADDVEEDIKKAASGLNAM